MDIGTKEIDYLRAHFVYILGLFILAILLYLINYNYVSLDYDEFFNLQIPKNMAENGIYATYYNLEYHLFDPLITTGPSTLLPIFLAFKTFGVDYLTARYIMAIFSVLMISMIYNITTKFFGSFVALFSSILVMLIPGFLLQGVKALGEFPAVLYFVIGIYLLCLAEKSNTKVNLFCAGVLFAFSVLSKQIFILVFFPILFYCLILKNNLLTRMSLISSFLTTLILFELYKLYCMGFENYLELYHQTICFLPAAGASPRPISILSIIQKLQFLSDSLYLRIDIFIIISIFLFVFCVIICVNNMQNKTYVIPFYLFFEVISIIFWFLFISKIAYRHIMSYILLIIPFFVYMVICFIKYYISYKGKTSRKVSILLILLLIIVPIMNSVYLNVNQQVMDFQIEKSESYVQLRFIELVKEEISDDQYIGYWDWWRAPEVSFFIKNNFIDLSRLDSLVVFSKNGIYYNLKNESLMYILITGIQQKLDPNLGPLEPLLGSSVISECRNTECYSLYRYNSFGWNESINLTKWRFITKNASVSIKSDVSQKSNISIEIFSFQKPRQLDIYFNGFLAKSQVIPTNFTHVNACINLSTGENTLKLISVDGCSRPCDCPEFQNSDFRCLSFAISNTTIF